MTSHPLKPGTQVYFTDDDLGALDLRTGRPCKRTVNTGERGLYLRPQPEAGQDWHLIGIEENIAVPVHESMFAVFFDPDLSQE